MDLRRASLWPISLKSRGLLSYVATRTVAGQWHIPGVFNDTTGPKCDANSTVETPYINNVIKELAKKPEARRL
jgi:hypothetical protein